MALYAHYRPHPRVQEDLSITNPVTGEVTYPPSMTKQEFVDECDINNILKQYSVTGMLNHVNVNAAQGAYIDLPDEMDFQTALQTVQMAETSFMTLPAKLRDRFGNDPAKFLEFMSNPENADEMRSLGLLNPLPAPPPVAPPPTEPELPYTPPKP